MNKNEIIFNHGDLYGIFVMSKEEAENKCIKLSLDTGDMYHWEYIAGRVIIKSLPVDIYNKILEETAKVELEFREHIVEDGEYE